MIAGRAERRLSFSATCLPPRVHSAYFRTIWNGWCSERRFQTHVKGCRFECGGDAQDSIEHYAFCPVVLEFFRRTHIPLTNHSFSAFLCLTPEGKEGELIVRFIALYAVYKAQTVISHSHLTTWDFRGLLSECSKSVSLMTHVMADGLFFIKVDSDPHTPTRFLGSPNERPIPIVGSVLRSASDPSPAGIRPVATSPSLFLGPLPALSLPLPCRSWWFSSVVAAPFLSLYI